MPKALVFEWGPKAEFRMALPESREIPSIVIGRESGRCDIVAPHEVPGRQTISRTHAQIFRRPNGYWIEDLESNNFTFVERQIVIAPTRIEMPCNLRLGEAVLRVHSEQVTEEQLEELSPRSVLEMFETSEPTKSETLPRLVWADARHGVHEQVRWAAAMQDVLDVLVGASRLRQAEAQLGEVLKIHLNAQRVSVALCIESNTIKEVLMTRKIKPSAAQSIQSTLIKSRSEIRHFPVDEGRVHVWGAQAFGARNQGYSMIVVCHPTIPEEKGEIKSTTGIVASVLKMIDPFVGALRELDQYQTNELEYVVQEPGPKMERLCEESGYIGHSPAIRRCLYKAEIGATRFLYEVTPKDGERKLPVICLLGESGTGKSHLARLIHARSNHAKGPFVMVNCAAITESLMSSELFGHEADAFTGAKKRKLGIFERADGGILFLDEVGHAPLQLQADILKVLDTGQFSRVGGEQTVSTNCYVILASIEHPLDLLKQDRFLEELWYRIEGFNLTVPPLRERIEDIEELVRFKLARLKAEYEKHSPSDCSGLTDRVTTLLKGHTWKGNVRQMMQCLEAAYALAPQTAQQIDVHHLPEAFIRELGIGGEVGVAAGPELDIEKTLKENESELRREYYVRLLARYKGQKLAAGRHAGVSHPTLQAFLKDLRQWFAHEASPAQQHCIRQWAGEYFHKIIGETPPSTPEQPEEFESSVGLSMEKDA